MPFGMKKASVPLAAGLNDVELSEDDSGHWPKSPDQLWCDIGPYTGMRYDELLDHKMLTVRTLTLLIMNSLDHL